MATVKVNLNGINELDLNLIGTVTATTSAGSTTVTQSVSGLATSSGVQQEAYTYASDTGTANAYIITQTPNPTIVAGSEIVFIAANSNTTASTVTVNGASYPITKNGTTPLTGGEITAGAIITGKFDGTNFQIFTGGASSPLTTKGDLYGYSTTNARVGVGADGTVLTADSTQGTGVSYKTISRVFGFNIGNGASGTNVGPMLVAFAATTLSSCVVVTKGSDSSTPLTFRILKNGVSVFSANPTVAAGTVQGTVTTTGTLTSTPLAVSANDTFSIDILSGTSNWQFTAQLET